MKGLHHIHLRKRKARGLEPFPANNRWLKIIDRIALFVGIIGPLTVIPQVLKIFLLKNATGVSVLSWAVPALLDIPWIVYGIAHRERPIAVTYSLWFIANALVVAGGGGTRRGYFLAIRAET